jgi:hypothetical protein
MGEISANTNYFLNIRIPNHAKVGHGIVQKGSVESYPPNPIRCYRITGTCRLVAYLTPCAPSAELRTMATLPTSVQCVDCSGAYASRSLDCPICLQETPIQKIRVKDVSHSQRPGGRISIVSPNKLSSCAQAPLPRPSATEISTQRDNAAPAPETGGLKVYPSQPRTQPKTAELPKQPPAHESRKQVARRVFLVNAVTVRMARARAALLTPNYCASTWTWTHPTT